MKKLLFVLALSLAVFLPRAQAIINPPYLGFISNEVFDQLTTVTNELAATNNVVANKKLLKVLLGAQKLIAKTKTNHVGGAKSLGVLNKSLGRSVLSNEFNPLIQGTADIYVNVFHNLLDALEDRVDASYPGKANEAARKALAKFEAAIDSADTNSNFLLVLKALGAAAKGEIGAQKAVVKAENAPAPPSGFSATIAGSGEPTFLFKPFLGSIGAARVGNAVNVIVQDVKISGGGTRQRVLNMSFPVLVDGTFTYTVEGAGNNWDLNYVSSLTQNGNVSGDAFEATSGTLTVTVNVAAKSVIGTFSFNAPGENNPGNVAQTSNGSFSLTWL